MKILNMAEYDIELIKCMDVVFFFFFRLMIYKSVKNITCITMKNILINDVKCMEVSFKQ